MTPMNIDVMQRLDAAMRAHIKHERAWLPHDRRGRWVVIEPGAGRYLKSASAELRRLADRFSFRRARRFSSLSRARAFARQVNGHVARWSRVTPFGGSWTYETPWGHALRTASAVLSPLTRGAICQITEAP